MAWEGTPGRLIARYARADEATASDSGAGVK